MNRIYRLIVLQFLLALVAVGQGIDAESNWYKEIGRGDNSYSGFDFTRYSRNDIQAARTRYLRIMSEKSPDEWEGSYSRQTMLGRAELIWSLDNGFVYAYVYHTLAAIDYGEVATRGDSILLISRKTSSGKPNRFLGGEHIRVKFGERHLLVQRDRLDEFAIFAAGLEVPTGRRQREIFTEEGFVWEKAGDEGKSLADLPVYPIRYAHLVRKPIRSKIVSVGRQRIKRETSRTSGTTFEKRLRALTLSSGSRHGVRIGMTFWIDDLEERVEIVSVNPNRSVGRLSRPVIDGEEFCRNNEIADGEKFPCRDPKIGMLARTKPGYF